MAKIKEQNAQTAIELAVFGAILIFAMGVMLRTAFTRSSQQHAILKATRLAMTQSYIHGDSNRFASRNFASVLLVEDRLTVASDKYGAIDRTPSIMQGTGTHTSNLFMPIDYGDSEDLPVFDLFVNGQHFPLTTAVFKEVDILQRNEGPCAGLCEHRIHGGTPYCDICPEVEPNCVDWEEEVFCHELVSPPCVRDPAAGNTCPCPALPAGNVSGSCSDCAADSIDMYTITTVQPCAKLYTIIDNHPKIPQWCNNVSGLNGAPCNDPANDRAVCSFAPPPAPPEPGCVLDADARFDLDRNDLDNIAGDVSVPSEERGRFAWQWYLVMGFNEGRTTEGGYPSSDLLGTPTPKLTGKLRMAEGLSTDDGDRVQDKNLDLDVDADLKLEVVSSIVSRGGIISSLRVRDSQGADVDFTVGDGEVDRNGVPVPRPGFVRDRDFVLYTQVRDEGPYGGTYLEINEGKLFSGKQFIRTASKKDSVDMVERVFQLSNNTGRFCLDDGTRVGNTAVEVCAATEGVCHTGDNLRKTCLEIPTKLLFIRSRILDVHGRKWVTDVSGDPNVEFQR